MTRLVDDAARALIERDEELKLHAYRDIGGVWTIGFGHTGPDVHPGSAVTAKGADLLERRDLARFAGLVEKLIGKTPATDNQFGAMVSLAYNIGDKAFARSTVLRRHLAGDHAAAGAAFGLWDEVHGAVIPGLVRRRAEERALYLTPDPPDAAAS